MNAVASFCGLCLLLVVGKFLRVKIKFLQKLYLPSAIIGGIIGLLVLSLGGESIPLQWHEGWGRLPGFLINIVFAGLFLGVKLPGIGKIWRTAGPQLAYGQIVAWGQYFVGIGIILLVLGPLLGVPDYMGVVAPVGLEGGHGTAGGLAETFTDLGWEAGGDLCLASATVGIVSAIVIGMSLINWAVNRGYVNEVKTFADQSDHERMGVIAPGDRPAAGRQTVNPDSIDSLALHVAVIGLAVLLGYAFQYLLGEMNDILPSFISELRIFTKFPLFPLCMIGGILLQIFFRLTGIGNYIDRSLIQRIGGTALDFLVVSAVATIKLETIRNNWLPFVTIVGLAILWNIFCVIFLARRMLPNCWFERAIAEMGQSMGVTATGLMLLRTVDPQSKTEAPAAFGYKQLLHEPFMGGGIWTSMAIPLVFAKGGWLIFGISATAIVVWLTIWKLCWAKEVNSN